MENNEAKKLAEELMKQGEKLFSFQNEGATEDQIAEFEKSKGIKLPDKFREWLTYTDGGNFYLPGGVQIYGIAHKPFIDIEDNDRPDDNYVVIGRTAWGETVVFKKGEEEIDIFDHETGKVDEEVRFKDFYVFLKGLYDLLGIGE